MRVLVLLHFNLICASRSNGDCVCSFAKRDLFLRGGVYVCVRACVGASALQFDLPSLRPSLSLVLFFKHTHNHQHYSFKDILVPPRVPCLPICVAVWCSVLQCGAVCCTWTALLQCVAVCCSVLQCVAVWCSVLHLDCSVAVCCSVLQFVAVWCSVLHLDCSAV